MKFSEFISAPETIINDNETIFETIGLFSGVDIVFDVDGKNEQIYTVIKTNPYNQYDKIYSTLKKHFELENEFFIIEKVPYDKLPESAVDLGKKVGVMFLSKEVRFGGYGVILRRIDKTISNKGEHLVAKGALLLSFPVPLKTINRRKRFRFHPRVEDYFCEISGFAADRKSPLPIFPITDFSDLGACIIISRIPEDKIPSRGDELFIRLTVFEPAPGYVLKRSVVVSEMEVKEGYVIQHQFVLKCRVTNTKKPNDQMTALSVQFLEIAREGTSSDPKKFPQLTYLPIDPEEGIKPLFAWVNKVQQKRLAEEKELSLE